LCYAVPVFHFFNPPATALARAGNPKEFFMAYVISDQCTACGKCKEICPVEAINEGKAQYTIDAEKCIDCGNCTGECPVDAISEG